MYIFLFIFLFIFIIILSFLSINYWKMIWKNSHIPDFTKWILCDKLIAKKFAEQNGFNVAKLYQYAQFPNQLVNNIKSNHKKQYVIKPVDLCDSGGVYVMKNGINLIDNKKYTFSDIQKNLVKLRSEIKQEYYMHNKMYNYKIPNTGYIMEELLLDNNKLPCDYKCYTYQGKIWFIANTYNRRMVNGKQKFDSVWMTRDWKPIFIKMIKKGYKYQRLPKPKGLGLLIKKVENISRKLNRHCRIDVYLVNGKTYFSEFTFFTGAFLHTQICNNILGLLWYLYPDGKNEIEEIQKLIPREYIK
jgi:hypothetical protein